MTKFQAPLGAIALAICAVCATPAAAQTRAALVQNIDEPGRNPYQEAVFSSCIGSQFCNFNYSAVPAGKRLVLTQITGYIDVAAGTFPNGSVSSSLGGNAYAAVHFTGVRGSASALGTRMYINQQVLAYFGPGEVPHGFMGVVSTSDTFSGGAQLQLSGYFVNLP